MNILKIGEVNVEKNKINARRDMHLRKIPIIDRKNTPSRVNPLNKRIPERRTVSKTNRTERTAKNQKNFPKIIVER